MKKFELAQQIELLSNRVKALEADNEALRAVTGFAKSSDGRLVRMSDGGVWVFDSNGNMAINAKHIQSASIAEGMIRSEMAARSEMR